MYPMTSVHQEDDCSSLSNVNKQEQEHPFDYKSMNGQVIKDGAPNVSFVLVLTAVLQTQMNNY